MDKLTYLAELAEGLARWVPERERQDILRYYAEYFEEAGPEREAEVIRELGDPWALSSRLAVEGGYVTQEQAGGWTPPKKKKWPWVLAVCAVLAVALIGSIVSAATALGQYIWRNNVAQTPVQTQDVAAIVEEGTGFESSDNGITYIEGEKTPDGSFVGFWTREDGNLDTFNSIDVDISFGAVTVTAGDDYTLDIQQVGDLGGYKLKWYVKDGVLTFRDESPKGFQLELNGLTGEHSLNVGITVPGDAQLDKLNIKTNLGNIFLSELAVEKKLDVKTNLGDVELYGVRAQEAKAKSDLGNVGCYGAQVEKELTLDSSLGDVALGMEELWEGVEIDLETSMGQVEASLGCRERDCGYQLKCSLGEVTLNGLGRGDNAEQQGSYPYHLEAKSSLGDVNVDFIQG